MYIPGVRYTVPAGIIILRRRSTSYTAVSTKRQKQHSTYRLLSLGCLIICFLKRIFTIISFSTQHLRIPEAQYWRLSTNYHAFSGLFCRFCVRYIVMSTVAKKEVGNNPNTLIQKRKSLSYTMIYRLVQNFFPFPHLKI